VSYSYYISPADYQTAGENGISPSTLEKRVRTFAWDKQTAITTPIRPRRDLTPFHKLAEANGIPDKTFKGRMRHNWDPERASTQPVTSRKDIVTMLHKRWDKERIYPKEAVLRAKENGVQYRTFQWRMRNGWSIKDASETKTLTTKEASSRAYGKSWWSAGPSLFVKKGARYGSKT